MHYGDSLAVECISVVHSFLRCIVGLNECSREHPLGFRTPLKMAVSDFVYSHCARNRLYYYNSVECSYYYYYYC